MKSQNGLEGDREKKHEGSDELTKKRIKKDN